MLWLEPDSKEVTKFRKRVYEEDLEIPHEFMHDLDNYDEFYDQFGHRTDFEDIWKYSDAKFLNSDLDQVLMSDDQSMISPGSVFNEDTYRAGHLIYCLKGYRKNNRSWMYQDWGPFYGHIKRAIELNKRHVISCHWAHNKKIAANIENHHRKIIGTDLHYFNLQEYYGSWEVMGKQQEVFGLDIHKRFADIEKLTMTENILPMGKYETIPVEAKYPHDPEKYGCVVELNIEPVDPELLRDACEETRSNSEGYFNERLDIYKIPASEALNWLRYNGFSGDTYDSTALNISGTTDLNDKVTDYIKHTYSKVKSKLFRQNYVIAKNNWETRWHRDHQDPSIHGFRLMVPIDPVHMSFRKGDIQLEPGKFYFVNNSLEHIGRLPKGYTERANLMAQMHSDIDILHGKVLL